MHGHNFKNRLNYLLKCILCHTLLTHQKQVLDVKNMLSHWTLTFLRMCCGTVWTERVVRMCPWLPRVNINAHCTASSTRRWRSHHYRCAGWDSIIIIIIIIIINVQFESFFTINVQVEVASWQNLTLHADGDLSCTCALQAESARWWGCMLNLHVDDDEISTWTLKCSALTSASILWCIPQAPWFS